MKIVATRRAFYKGEIIETGRIVDIPNKQTLPSWGKRITEPEKTPNNNSKPNNPSSEDELKQELENLKTVGIEKGIFIQDTENKSVIEQINELKNKLFNKGNSNV